MIKIRDKGEILKGTRGGKNTYYIQRNKWNDSRLRIGNNANQKASEKIVLKALERERFNHANKRQKLKWSYQYMQIRFQKKEGHFIMSKESIHQKYVKS